MRFGLDDVLLKRGVYKAAQCMPSLKEVVVIELPSRQNIVERGGAEHFIDPVRHRQDVADELILHGFVCVEKKERNSVVDEFGNHLEQTQDLATIWLKSDKLNDLLNTPGNEQGYIHVPAELMVSLT